jgi:hypothetical protein
VLVYRYDKDEFCDCCGQYIENIQELLEVKNSRYCCLSDKLVEMHKGRTSISGRFASLEYITHCEFRGQPILTDEACISQISGKQYFYQEQMISSISGITGHQSEFVNCSITKKPITKSEAGTSISGRLASLRYLTHCEFSGQPILIDEACISQISGKQYFYLDQMISSISGITGHQSEFVNCSITEKPITKSEAGTSISGRLASLRYLTHCEFSGQPILIDEACISQISGKQYFYHDQMISSISGITGHQSEFVYCSITKKPITKSEAGTSISGRLASLQYLTRCEFNNKPILTNEARVSQISGKQYYCKEQKISSISLLRGHKSEFVYSSKPQFKLSCCVKEAIQCQWSNELFYPDDTRKCPITKLCFSKHFLNSENVFEIMDYVFDKTNKCSDDFELLKNIENMVRIHYKHHIKIFNALLSPNHDKMYIYAQKSIFFGLFTREIGFLYSINDHKIIGKIIKRRNS